MSKEECCGGLLGTLGYEVPTECYFAYVGLDCGSWEYS